MNTPLVSVIMLVYNNVRFLKEAIDSVIDQTYQNWELIIHDDGSTDGAWEVAQILAKKDSRIRAYRNEKNLWIVKNRKEAFLKTKGELICHLDGDDVLFPYSIESMVSHLLALPEVMLAQSDSIIIDESSRFNRFQTHKPYTGNLVELGWRHFGMYKREAYDQCAGYNTEITNACEDGDLFMQIADKFPFIQVHEVLYKHRATSNNASGKNQSCNECSCRPVCNFIRVWAKHANMNHLTMQPLGTNDGRQTAGTLA